MLLKTAVPQPVSIRQSLVATASLLPLLIVHRVDDKEHLSRLLLQRVPESVTLKKISGSSGQQLSLDLTKEP